MKRAFSLVELSIVLVILGLLVGGILSGQSLIRASELRSVYTQQQRFVTAVHAFRDKYFALPGDMTNAQSIWGVADADPATCVTTAGTGTQTCNGDGNGIVYTSTGSNELYRFWQHLANAGIIEGTYDGITHGSNFYSATTANSPAGKLSNSLWFVNSWGTVTGDTSVFNATYRNGFTFGAAAANNFPASPIFRTEELWNIDRKMDDGKPATGAVLAQGYPAGLSTCTTTIADNPATLTAEYLLTSTSTACAAIFNNAF